MNPRQLNFPVNEYRTDEDIVQNFLNECCVKDDSARVARKDLFAEYVHWARDNGFHHLFSAKKIALELARLGITGDKGNRYWIGISLEAYIPTEASTL